MNKIKHYFKNIFHRTDFSGLSVFGRGQSFDWEVLLSLFLIAIIVLLYFSVHVFLGVRAGDIYTDDFKPPVHNESINKVVLDKVVKSFDVRAETLKSLKAQKPVFVDPSL